MDCLGIRNNNPLNIRFSPMNNWKGQVGSEKGFCVFDTPGSGFRAALVLLCNYQRKGYDTISKIVSHWAPPSENNTEAYIAHCVSYFNTAYPLCVSRHYDSNSRLTSLSELVVLAKAMFKFECRCDYEVGLRFIHELCVVSEVCKFPPLKV